MTIPVDLSTIETDIIIIIIPEDNDHWRILRFDRGVKYIFYF